MPASTHSPTSRLVTVGDVINRTLSTGGWMSRNWAKQRAPRFPRPPGAPAPARNSVSGIRGRAFARSPSNDGRRRQTQSAFVPKSPGRFPSASYRISTSFYSVAWLFGSIVDSKGTLPMHKLSANEDNVSMRFCAVLLFAAFPLLAANAPMDILEAAKKGNAKEIEALLAKGADLEARDK